MAIYDAWIDATLLNGWVNNPATYEQAGYHKERASKRVTLRGFIKSGTATAGTTLFVLPDGYRPLTFVICPIVTNDVFGAIQILPTGEVQIISASAVYVSLAGVSFLFKLT